MSTLIIGRDGQVGYQLQKLLPEAVHWTRRDADLNDGPGLLTKLLNLRPKLIINAAAYTAVDQAEKEPSIAWRVNSTAVAHMAEAASSLDCPVIHFSTDYVFDGQTTTPYESTAPLSPVNAYGASKLGGELVLRFSHTKHVILRTSWVFSEHGRNFFTTMIRLGREKKDLQVVDDQLGVPNYAGDLAIVVSRLCERFDETGELPWGVHHLSGHEETSWHGFAERIFAVSHKLGLLQDEPHIAAVSTDAFPTLAKRPHYSVLKPSKILFDLTDHEIDWHAGIETAVSHLLASKR